MREDTLRLGSWDMVSLWEGSVLPCTLSEETGVRVILKDGRYGTIVEIWRVQAGAAESVSGGGATETVYWVCPDRRSKPNRARYVAARRQQIAQLAHAEWPYFNRVGLRLEQELAAEIAAAETNLAGENDA